MMNLFAMLKPESFPQLRNPLHDLLNLSYDMNILEMRHEFSVFPICFIYANKNVSVMHCLFVPVRQKVAKKDHNPYVLQDLRIEDTL